MFLIEEIFIRFFNRKTDSAFFPIHRDDLDRHDHAFLYYIRHSLHAPWSDLRDMHHAVRPRIELHECPEISHFDYFAFQHLSYFKLPGHFFYNFFSHFRRLALASEVHRAVILNSYLRSTFFFNFLNRLSSTPYHHPDMIGMGIGGGGKTIKEIKEKSGAEITIEDNGTVYFTGKGQSAEMAKKIVEEMTREFKVGEVLKGEVVKVADFGAFVQLNARADGMVHISEIAPWRVERVSDIIKEGMIVPVKVISVDREKGRIGLSIKEADKNFFDQKHGSRTKSQ